MADAVNVETSIEVLLHQAEDLAPDIVRQRLVIEGTPAVPIGSDAISAYLVGLSEVCQMRVLLDPVTHLSERFGWAGWVHWETSGAHFYAWEQPRLFFSVDVYTCRAFDAVRAVEYTRSTFGATALVAYQF